MRRDTLFIAICGNQFDGHQFIEELEQRGVRYFMVNKDYNVQSKKSNFLLVDDTLTAFQQLASYHRDQYSIPVVGITGSNAKTICKEWSYQLMHQEYSIVKSPKSYNSQVGVPLSVLQIEDYHQMAIFEAGISTILEMKPLAKIIKPTVGIFTNIGSAHSEGFESVEQKIEEKLQLFSSCHTIIYCKDHLPIAQAINNHFPNHNTIAWSIQNNRFVFDQIQIDLPTHSQLFFHENIGHCIALLLHFSYSEKQIKEKLNHLQPIPHRLQVLQGKEHSTIINDSYNNDFAGLEVALQFAHQQTSPNPLTVILSSFEQSNLLPSTQLHKLTELLTRYHVKELIGIGDLYQQPYSFPFSFQYFESTKAFLQSKFSPAHKTILIKGARSYQLEQITNTLQQKTHETIWEINLPALVNNLNVYKSLLQDNVKLMVMVKALAYGTSAHQIAHLLEHLHVDYLGVAYPDEGKQLRNHGISLPILVLNTAESSFQTAIDAQLDISIYSINQCKQFIQYCQKQSITNYPIHIKIDTGMHRLGIEQQDMQELISLITSPEIKVVGIYSHLATADDISFTSFTTQQRQTFDHLVSLILPHLSQKPILHLLNSSGIVNSRIPQYDMVRLGIGLHGISSNTHVQNKLQQVGTLKATISQIKTIQPGDYVGYAGAYKADKHITIATITIGYADGYDRRFGNGVGKVLIHNTLASTVGNICMDMTMIDITHIHAKPGDEVIITSPQLPITQLAASIHTIPYELLTDVSPRIPRRFIEE